MQRRTVPVSDFSAGEIAPWFFGRTEDTVYYKGCSSMLNFMPRMQGGFRKRPGTLFVGHTHSDAVAQLYAIKVSSTLSYIFEFTNLYCQVWTLTSGTITGPVAITNVAGVPYLTAELGQMQFAWMYPDLFIAHQNHPPARIRYSPTGPTFTYSLINFVTTQYVFTGNIVAGTLNFISGITGVPGQTNTALPLPSALSAGLWVLTDTAGVLPAGTYITQVYPSATPGITILAASAQLSANATGASASDTFILQEVPLPFANMITNGNCELTVPPCVLGQLASVYQCTAVQDTAQFHSGADSFKMTYTAGAGAYSYNMIPYNFAAMSGFVAGHTYLISMWVYVPVAVTPANVVSTFSYGNSGVGFSTFVSTNVPTVNSAWQYLKMTVTLPANTVGCGWYIQVNQTSGNIWFDDISCVDISYLPRCVSTAYQRVYWANSQAFPEDLYASIIGVWDSGDPVGALGNMNMNLFEATTYQNSVMVTDTSGVPTSTPPTYQGQQATNNAVTDSDGIQVTLTETQSELLWIGGSHDLLIGAADGEIAIPCNTGNAVGISPNTISDNMVSKAGSSSIQGDVLISGMVFVQLGGFKVFEMTWQGVSNMYDPPVDLSYFSGHLFLGNPITAWDYVQSPDTIAYFLRTDGTMACLHYDPANGVRSWWRFKTHLDDVITSMASTTGTYGDVLFLSVTRSGANYVEILSNANWNPAWSSALTPWNYMDCAAQKYNAVAFTTITLDISFVGATVGVVADGVYKGTVTVAAGGVVTIPGGVSAHYCTAGLLMTTPSLSTMPLSPQGRYGASVTDIKNIDHVGLVLYNTLDIQVGINGLTYQTCPEVVAANGVLPTPYSGVPQNVPVPSTFTRELIFTVQSSAPLPCEVTALTLEVTL